MATPADHHAAASLAAKAQPVLGLSSKQTHFPAISRDTPDVNVIFDEVMQQVFVTRKQGTVVQIISINGNPTIKLTNLPPEPIKSMRYSLDLTVLAIRRTNRAICLLNRDSTAEYKINVKNKLAEIKDFFWTQADEMVIVTSMGLECYRVNFKRKSTKLLKAYNLSLSSCFYSAAGKVLIARSSMQPTVFNPFRAVKGGLAKLGRVEVDVPRRAGSVVQLHDQDIGIIHVYGRFYITICKNNGKDFAGARAEIDLYLVTTEGVILKHSLQLYVNGRFMINVVDNLILVHHQTSMLTYVFDVEHDNTCTSHVATSLGTPVQHHEAVFSCAVETTAPGNTNTAYTESWLTFQPDVVIDARLGTLWHIQLNPTQLAMTMISTVSRSALLLRRTNAKDAILNTIRSEVEDGSASTIERLSQIFDSITLATSVIDNDPKSAARLQLQRVTSQDIYDSILVPLAEQVDRRDYLVAMVVTYIRSLVYHGVAVDHFIYTLVIETLIESGHFYQLHQFLQYHVVEDSQHVGCMLLSLEKKYPPAYQLALDMFKRLDDSGDWLLDAMLSKGQVLGALRYVRSQGDHAVRKLPVRRFLEAARSCDDEMVFFNVYQYLVRRNVDLRGKPSFTKADNVEEFVKHFQMLYG